MGYLTTFFYAATHIYRFSIVANFAILKKHKLFIMFLHEGHDGYTTGFEVPLQPEIGLIDYIFRD